MKEDKFSPLLISVRGWYGAKATAPFDAKIETMAEVHLFSSIKAPSFCLLSISLYAIPYDG